jgi:hypothetical protein
MNHLLDRHGYIDVRLENWDNVWFDKSKDGADIEGCSINCLLHAFFILNGYREDLLPNLPGGFSCWDAITEPVFIMISSYVTINELSARIQLLCEEYLLLRSLTTSDVTVLERYYTISNLLYGALIVVYIWVANFNGYIEDNNLITLRIRMAHLGNEIFAYTWNMHTLKHLDLKYRTSRPTRCRHRH